MNGHSSMPLSPPNQLAPPGLPEPQFPFDLPSEVVLNALGTNYNTVVRSWLLKQYRAQLDHHKMMCHYYKAMIAKLEDHDIKYEKEPEATPVTPAVAQGGPIKLSDLAKQPKAASSQPIATYSQDKLPQKKEKKETPAAPVGHGGNVALSTSLASNEVKFDKKPTKVKVEVSEDEDNSTQQLNHFTRPQVARRQNQRTDIKDANVVKEDKEDGDVSTWAETPNAFNDPKKESKFKTTFGKLFTEAKKESQNPTSPTPVSPPPSNAAFTSNLSSNNNSTSSSGPASSINNSYNSGNSYSTGIPKPPLPPSLPPSIPPTPTSAGGPPPLSIPKPPPSALHSSPSNSMPPPPPF